MKMRQEERKTEQKKIGSLLKEQTQSDRMNEWRYAFKNQGNILLANNNPVHSLAFVNTQHKQRNGNVFFLYLRDSNGNDAIIVKVEL